MVGMERSILPAIAEQEFHLAARTAVLSFIVVFGVAKALTNYCAGRLSDRIGRKHVLVAGWLVAVPVPFLLMWAPSWKWVLVANVLLGISQGLTWSTTVIMKIDLVGPRAARPRDGPERVRRLCRGGRERARDRLDRRALRPAPGAVLSRRRLRRRRASRSRYSLVRETHGITSRTKSTLVGTRPPRCAHARARSSGARRSRDRNLSSVSQAGLVNNLNDGMAWGLFPLVFAAAGMGLDADRHARRHLSGDVGHRASSSPARCRTASGASG